MEKKTIADDVRRFILTSIPSVPYLEALLLLRAEPGTHWDRDRLARRLYVGEAQAQDLLEAVTQSRIATRMEDGSFLYAPEAELSRALDALADTYSNDLVGVTDLIHSRVEKRAQQFADAFRWKKDTR